MAWLWGYCPRRIVARLGQHKESETYALLKVVPFWPIVWRSPSKYFMDLLSRSSVRTKTMFGRSAAAADLTEPITVTSTITLATSTAVAIEANSRTVLAITTRPSLLVRRG